MAKEYKKDDLQNLPGCAKDFIKLVIKKMRYRKKVRADVAAELAAHFEDELKSCASAEEKGKKAQQLIADFGDAKLLGVLLRRAKKRCRPLWRTIVARTCQAIVLTFVCLVLYIAWFLTGKPKITVDYVAKLNQIVQPTADESLNAASLYNQAAELYETLPKGAREILNNRYRDANSQERQLAKKALDQNNELFEQIFELVAAGANKPYYWQQYKAQEGGGMMSILFPNLSTFRRLAYNLEWRAKPNAEQGQYEEAFNAMKTCYKFGQHLRKGNGVLIEQLVGIAIEAYSLRVIGDILSENQIDSSILASLQKDLEHITADEDFSINMKAEKFSMYDEIQRCFTEDYFGRGHLYLPRISGLKGHTSFMAITDEDFHETLLQLWNVFFTHPNKQQTLKSMNEFYDYIEQLSRKSPAKINSEKELIDKRVNALLHNNVFMGILTPAFMRVIEISYRLPVDVGATIATIAVLRYQQDIGKYPENLDELVKITYLKKLPIDTFSDKPLVYKKTADGFLLYGIGSNFKDDGGEFGTDKTGKPRLWGKQGDAVFWPRQK